MIFNQVNLVSLLQKETQKVQQDRTLSNAKKLINNEFKIEEDIRNRILGRTTNNLLVPLNSLDQSRIISLKAIQNICIDYRLRCLDARLFKGDIPYEAVSKIKQAEKETGQQFTEFKIIASASRFKLFDSTQDPVLLARLNNENYYLIHKWGKDLSWYQKIIAFPFKNVKTLGITSALLGFIFAVLLPTDIFPDLYQKTVPLALLGKTFTWFISSTFIFTLSLILGIVSVKDFSENVWDDKYFN